MIWKNYTIHYLTSIFTFCFPIVTLADNRFVDHRVNYCDALEYHTRYNKKGKLDIQELIAYENVMTTEEEEKTQSYIDMEGFVLTTPDTLNQPAYSKEPFLALKACDFTPISNISFIYERNNHYCVVFKNGMEVRSKCWMEYVDSFDPKFERYPKYKYRRMMP